MSNSNVKYVSIGLIVLALGGVFIALMMRGRQEPRVITYEEQQQQLARGEESGSRTGWFSWFTGDSDEDQDQKADNADDPAGSPAGSEDQQGATEGGEETAEGTPDPDTPADGAVADAGGIAGVPGAPGSGNGTTGSSGGSGTTQSGSVKNTGPADGSSTAEGSLEDGEDTAGNEEDPAGMVVVGGSVLRGEQPVAQARLSLTSSETGQTLNASSGDEGSYRFPAVEEGEYTLYLLSPTSPSSRRRLMLFAGENQLGQDFVIPPLPPVQGRVVSESTGEPIARATVEVYEGGQLVGSVQGDSQGDFELFPLEAGAYTARGSADGYLPGEKPFQVDADGSNQLVIVELPQAAVVVAQVVGGDGSYISGALVSLFGSSVYNDPFSRLGTKSSDGAGIASFALPEGTGDGSFRIGAYKEGMAPGYSGVYTPANLPQNGEPIVVQLPFGGSVVGRVVDSEGTPLEGADVSVKTGFPNTGAILQRFNISNLSTRTNAEGFFGLTGIEAGNLVLTITADGYISNEPNATITNNQATDMGDITLEEEDAGAKPGRIFGLVVDELGRPMVSHNVFIKGSGGEFGAQTDSRGGFKIDDIPNGNYVIYTNGSLLRGETFIVVDQTYPFARPGEDRVYLVYDLGQSIRFRALNARGEPVTNMRVGVRVRYNGTNGYNGEKETFGLGYDENVQTSTGVVNVDDIISGTANLTIFADGIGSIERNDIFVSVGETVDLGDIYLQSGADLEGVVVSATDGSRVGGIQVQAVAPSGSPPTHPLNVLRFETNTDVGGNFRLSGLPEGQLVLVLSRSGWATLRIENVSVSANQANNVGELELFPGAVLRGRVTTPEGTPINDVQMTVTGQTVFTDRDGQYYFDKLDEGTATLEALDRSGGNRRRTVQVNLVAGQETVENIVMEPSG